MHKTNKVQYKYSQADSVEKDQTWRFCVSRADLSDCCLWGGTFKGLRGRLSR